VASSNKLLGCCHQLQCTELLLSVQWTATTDAGLPMQKYELTVLLVLFQALPVPHPLVQSKRLWENLRYTLRSIPTTRLLQATLWTYTRERWGILQQLAVQDEEEASPHRRHFGSPREEGPQCLGSILLEANTQCIIEFRRCRKK
jgi:hypothetical protein